MLSRDRFDPCLTIVKFSEAGNVLWSPNFRNRALSQRMMPKLAKAVNSRKKMNGIGDETRGIDFIFRSSVFCQIDSVVNAKIY